MVSLHWFKAISQSVVTEKTYTKSELVSDLDYLINAILETHPNPFSVL